MKIILTVENEDCGNLGSMLDMRMDKPLLLEIITDTETLNKERLQISPEQRKFIFAIVKDISEWTGENKENQRKQLAEMYCEEQQIEMFSLSDCMSDRAGDFITWLINFCFEEGIPLSECPTEGLTDIEGYVHVCISQRKCCVCGSDGVVVKWDAPPTDTYLPLCDKHKDEAIKIGRDEFEERYHVYGVRKP